MFLENEWVEANVPELYRDAKFEDLDLGIRDVFWNQPRDKSFFIWGPTGTGKTHLTMVLILDRIRLGVQPIRKTFRQMMLQIKAGFDRNVPEEDTIRNYLRTELLVVDDIGACSVSDYGTEALLHVIDTRIEWKKMTVLTSNHSPAALSTELGDRFASRIKTFTTIKLGGVDRRIRQEVPV